MLWRVTTDPSHVDGSAICTIAARRFWTCSQYQKGIVPCGGRSGLWNLITWKGQPQTFDTSGTKEPETSEVVGNGEALALTRKYGVLYDDACSPLQDVLDVPTPFYGMCGFIDGGDSRNRRKAAGRDIHAGKSPAAERTMKKYLRSQFCKEYADREQLSTDRTFNHLSTFRRTRNNRPLLLLPTIRTGRSSARQSCKSTWHPYHDSPAWTDR